MNESKIKEMFKHHNSEIIKIGCLVLLYFGTNIYLSFATDTYANFEAGFGKMAANMLYGNARVIIALIYELHYLSGLSLKSFYYISSILALAFLGAAIWIMQKILTRYLNNENQRILLSFISIVNIFIIEYFMFMEKCGFMLAILFNILGIFFIESFFRTGNKKHFGCAILSIGLAVFTYQSTIALFMILCMLFVYKYADNFKKYIFNLFYVGIAYIIPVVMSMCTLKFVFQSKRIDNGQDELVNIISDLNRDSNLKNYVYEQLKRLFIDTFKILPSYYFGIILLVVIFISVALACFGKNSMRQIVHIIFIGSASCIFSAAPMLAGGWPAMRILYPFASIIGSLVINIYVNQFEYTQRFKHKLWKITNAVVMFAVTVLLIGQYFSFNKVCIDKYKLNLADEIRSDYVGQAISDYQDNTGNIVTKIAFYQDASITYPPYPDLYCDGDLIVSSFYTSWSDISALNYYLGTDYQKIDREEKYIEYFSNKDWWRLSQEQLIFDGDTLHLCVY